NLIVSDIAAVFNLQFTKQNKFGIFVDTVKAKIAGGSVYTKDITIKNDNKKYHFVLFVKDVNAAKLLAMANQKRLQVKGLLNGNLTMEYGVTGFSVKSGSLHSSNGIVRYLVDKKSSEFKSMDPAVQQVLEILGDFHYRKLVLSMGENTINDQAIVTIRALGANADFYANSPVDFNFKITGPLRRMLYFFFVEENAKQDLLQLSTKKD
ncbi:MAG: YdbH domain-containing protein, partial [Candidatus Thorarchaeota archaeon]